MISELIDFMLHLDKHLGGIISTYGAWTYGLLFLIIFCETGLVVAPFLPGDSLLFITGVFAAQGSLELGFVLILLCIAAFLGDTTNYWLGHHASKKLEKYIRKEHLEMTHAFYERHGGKTIILARFMPIVRTLAPFVAGMGSMNYGKFFLFNVVGALVWVNAFVLGGYFFGNLSIVKDNMTLVIFAIIILSFVPAVIEYLRHKRSKKPHHMQQAHSPTKKKDE